MEFTVLLGYAFTVDMPPLLLKQDTLLSVIELNTCAEESQRYGLLIFAHCGRNANLAIFHQFCRQRLLKGGKFYDVLIYSVLRSEYQGKN